ncbi:MAG: NAD(P)H dehydrogenase assembly family protein [Cyanobium sp.]
MNATTSEPEREPGSEPDGPMASLPAIGTAVRLNGPLPYLKTADPMPMLRPPDLIDPGEMGVVVELRPLAMLAVRFRRGTFLLKAAAVSPAPPMERDPG